MSLAKTRPVPVSPDRLEKLLGAAERAADKAAEVTLAHFRNELHVDNKAGENSFDPVTQADRQAELAIRETLQAEFPDVGFYGEEHDAIESSGGLTWVVDPIDGTRAFMSGLPLWGTLIGLFDGQNAILGLMDQPFTGERFSAVAGRSTLRRHGVERRLRCRRGVSLAGATLYCTTPDIFDTPASRASFERIRDAVQLARYGGDCYAYALLAAGYVDLVIDCDLKPYDIVALIPLIENAGGVVSNWDADSGVDGGYIVAAATPELHAEALALLSLE